MQEISKFYRSFSGTDSLVFALFPGTPPITLGTLTTISYSIFRDKKPITVIGNINVKGFSRGTRVVAGTMIFTLINQHWVNDLLEQCPWLQGYESLKADELPMFDLMVVSANEYGATASMFIYGVDVTDEAQVLSIEDLFTENQFSFIARNIDTFKEGTVNKNQVKFRSNKELTTYNDWTITMPETDSALSNKRVRNNQTVNKVQQALKNKSYDIPKITGVLDHNTEKAIMSFQADNKLSVSGYIDTDTYLKLFENNYTGTNPVYTNNKNGALVYKDTSTTSDIVIQLPYKTNLVVLDELDGWYRTTVGYIRNVDVYIDTQDTSMPSYMTSTIAPGTTMATLTSNNEKINIVDYVNNFKITVNPANDVTAVFDICSYFNNGHISKMKKVISIPGNTRIDLVLKEYINYFIYNDAEGTNPYMTEVIVNVNNKLFKWIVRY